MSAHPRPRYAKNKPDAAAGLPEHPFVVASHKTFRVEKKHTIPRSRAEELAQLARAPVTRCPEFTPRESGLSPGTDITDRDFEHRMRKKY